MRLALMTHQTWQMVAAAVLDNLGCYVPSDPPDKERS
jgi:hypothetical protein